MQFRVDAERVPDRTKVPAPLRPLPAWTQHGSPQPDHTWKITIGGLFKTDLADQRQDLRPGPRRHLPEARHDRDLGDPQQTSVAHLMHLHHTDWYLLARNGKPPPPWEDCLKETFFVYPGERILVAGHFTDYTGKFVDPLPHARPRGPRPDEPVPGRRS